VMLLAGRKYLMSNSCYPPGELGEEKNDGENKTKGGNTTPVI